MVFTGRVSSPREGFQQDVREVSGLLVENKAGIRRFMGLGSLEDVTYPLYLVGCNMEMIHDRNTSLPGVSPNGIA